MEIYTSYPVLSEINSQSNLDESTLSMCFNIKIIGIKKLTIYRTTGYAGSIAARPCPAGDEAIEELRQSNGRYVEGQPINPRSDQGRRTETATGGQHPHSTVPACSDSRVPVESLFDQGIGDVQVSIPTVVRGQNLANSLGERASKVLVKVNTEDEHVVEFSFLYRQSTE